MRFPDNVIDVNYYPIDPIRQIAFGNRKIGLGAMRFADCLVLLGIKYDCDEAVEFAETVSKFIQDHAHQAGCTGITVYRDILFPRVRRCKQSPYFFTPKELFIDHPLVILS